MFSAQEGIELATYRYWAIHGETGKRTQDVIEIDNVTVFLQEMHRQGYIVTSLKKAPSCKGLPDFFHKNRTVHKVDKGMALMELSAFLKAGIPLKNALERMAAETPPAISRVMRVAVDNLEQGVSFHEAIASQTRFFDQWEIRAIEAAEASGTLADSLEYIGDETLKSHDFSSKVSSSMIYPVLVVAVTMVVAAILVMFVIPSFAGVIGEENLPRATKLLLAISGFVRRYWFAIFGILLAGWFLLKRLFAKEDRYGVTEQLALRIPGWGKILKNSYLVRFGKTFSTLLESGVRVLPALEYAGQATGSALFVRTAIYVRKEVEKGARIGDSMRKSGAFPNLFCELAAAGESSGTLPEMVMKAARFYEGEVNRKLDSLSSMIEPVLILIVGIMVGFLGYTVMGPILRSLEMLG